MWACIYQMAVVCDHILLRSVSHFQLVYEVDDSRCFVFCVSWYMRSARLLLQGEKP